MSEENRVLLLIAEAIHNADLIDKSSTPGAKSDEDSVYLARAVVAALHNAGYQIVSSQKP